MNVLYFSRVSEADTKVQLLMKSLRFFEAITATEHRAALTLMQCQAIVARAMGFERWAELEKVLRSMGDVEIRNLFDVRYVDLRPNQEDEFSALVKKLRGAINVETDERLFRHAVKVIGFGYSPSYGIPGLEFVKPMLESSLTNSQFWALEQLGSARSRALRYRVGPKSYSEICHIYEVKKAEILGLPKPKKRKYLEY